ncbi:MAG: SDR family oxidoreductase [Verrucomicrobia bacterium]|nr:SDR family oxidoreductase [Cytophagales bacterium]
MSFSDKVVWITGASSGIGEALTYAFAKQGAKIIISARRETELERVKTQANSENIYILPLDLVESETFADKTAQAIKAFGKIDILIHNGGISQRSLVAETEMEVHRKLMEVDYFGYVGLTKEILPHFQSHKTGHFVVISSVMGKLGTPMRAAYAAAKHALHGFFDCLRAEVWQDNIQVTVICPGFVQSNVTINALNAKGEKFGVVSEENKGGYPADKTADQILKAIDIGKYEAFVGKKLGKEHLAMFISRFLPSVMMNIAKKQVPK